MPKLIIEIEGTEDELRQIAGHFCDGGGEEQFQPRDFEDAEKYISFDYAKCFEAWGYDAKADGPDRRIIGTVEKDDGPSF